jgi:hypothetical protein
VLSTRKTLQKYWTWWTLKELESRSASYPMQWIQVIRFSQHTNQLHSKGNNNRNHSHHAFCNLSSSSRLPDYQSNSVVCVSVACQTSWIEKIKTFPICMSPLLWTSLMSRHMVSILQAHDPAVACARWLPSWHFNCHTIPCSEELLMQCDCSSQAIFIAGEPQQANLNWFAHKQLRVYGCMQLWIRSPESFHVAGKPSFPEIHSRLIQESTLIILSITWGPLPD